MRIPLSGPDIGEAEIAAVTEVLRSGRLSLGPRLTEFEAAMAAYCGSAHAVAVSSGTAALHLGLLALGVGPGDEVITSPFSFVASANAICYVGARPVFVDIDPHTLNLDVERIEAAVTARTRAILPVHVFGRAVPMRRLREIATRHGLVVVEDACEALGGELGGAKLGTFGDVGVCGFYANKPITTAEGGVLLTEDREVAEAVRRLRNHGRPPGESYRHAELGYNYRLSELQSALGIVQLGRLERFLERRAAIAEAYRRRLRHHPDLVLPDDDDATGRTGWFVYAVRLAERRSEADRDRVLEGLAERGIGCGKYFPPIHLQPHYRRLLGHRPGDFPIAEGASRRTLALPFYNDLREEQIAEVCRAVIVLMP